MTISLEELRVYHAAMRRDVYNSYLESSTPWGQSGFSGPEPRWIACRRPIADCVEKSGRFLDIGCANGYLLECLLRWTAERGLVLEPYGVDIVDGLVALARKRLPDHPDQIEVADALTWNPPVVFDYVRTELCYVPSGSRRTFVERILSEFLAEAGTLLIAEYHSKDDRRTKWQSNVVRKMGFTVSKTKSGFWKGRELTRLSVLLKDDNL
jgi:SAM-dependent methyltransferase